MLENEIKEYSLEESTGKAVVYLLISPNNKKYVGQTWNVRGRWGKYRNLHTKEQPALDSALRKYGPENFKYKIIFITDNQSDLDSKEIEFMEMFKCRERKFGYNIRPGGERSRQYDETRRKLSKALSGENHPNWGKHLSQETRDKIAKANTGYKPTKETIKKNSESHKGIRPSQETIKKKSEIQLNIVKYKKWEFLHILVSPMSETFHIKNLNHFCRNNGLNSFCMRNIIYGTKKTYKGWTVTRVPITNENANLALDRDIFPN